MSKKLRIELDDTIFQVKVDSYADALKAFDLVWAQLNEPKVKSIKVSWEAPAERAIPCIKTIREHLNCGLADAKGMHDRGEVILNPDQHSIAAKLQVDLLMQGVSYPEVILIYE